MISQRASYRPSHRHLVSSSHLVPVVVSSAAFPYRAPFSFARRYLSPSRPRSSLRLSFRSPFRRRSALRLVVVLSRFPSRLSSKHSVRRCSRFPSYPPPSLRRRFIRRPLPPRAPFRLARRSSFRSVLVPFPRPVPRLVPSSFRPSFRLSFVGSSSLPVPSTR